MRLTRHAKNRLRWIGRRHPGVTERSLLEGIPGSETIGYRTLTLVIDESAGVLITVWVE